MQEVERYCCVEIKVCWVELNMHWDIFPRYCRYPNSSDHYSINPFLKEAMSEWKKRRVYPFQGDDS